MTKQNATPEELARAKVRALWQAGDLFHVTSRFPDDATEPRVDRLAGILKRGLVAPARCDQGTVRRNIRITIEGAAIPYDSLVFLHRMCDWSRLYTRSEPGRFTVIVDPAHPVLTLQEMGPAWMLLCPDEVYVRDQISAEELVGLVVDVADAEAVLGEFLDDLRRLALPLYDIRGRVLWPFAEPSP